MMESVMRSRVLVMLDSTRRWRLFIRQSSSLRNFPAAYYERHHERIIWRKAAQPPSDLSEAPSFTYAKRWSTSTSRSSSVDSEDSETGNAILRLSPSCVKGFREGRSKDRSGHHVSGLYQRRDN
ncbi:hypothetical protein RvY_01980-2 [Ramazzottius varieornatus]|uniref:Uncharacterized protein n=1 Tax=Ramazzottius varieornatus TaxID=947166 RepID=A0A1D1ULK7_RAMVA|nr:hypothetical protein RvY_01980-2 [Ramazzottius varieornatus]